MSTLNQHTNAGPRSALARRAPTRAAVLLLMLVVITPRAVAAQPRPVVSGY